MLRGWRVRIRQIGVNVGRKGMSDGDVIPLLRRMRSVTFFTCDLDYYVCRRTEAVDTQPAAALDSRQAQ